MLFEIRKILNNKIVIFLILFTVVVSFVYYVYAIGTFSDEGAYGMYNGSSDIYSRFSGEVTEEKISELKELLNSSSQVQHGDLLQAQDLILLSKYIEDYHKNCEAKIKSAERIKAENASLSESNVYFNRLADKVISHYQNRSILLLGDYSAVNYFAQTQSLTYPSLLLVLLCVFVSAESFCAEKRSGVYKINFTSRKGRLGLYKNKLLALMVFSGCITIIFTVVQIIAVFLKYSISQINAPLQINQLFSECPFNVGFLQYVVAIFLARFLGCLFICTLTVFVAVLVDNLIAASIGTLGISMILFWLYQSTLEFYGNETVAISKNNLHHSMINFSPICLINPQCHFVSNNYTNILNYPITSIAVNITFTIILTVLLGIVGGALSVRKRRKCS